VVRHEAGVDRRERLRLRIVDGRLTRAHRDWELLRELVHAPSSRRVVARPGHAGDPDAALLIEHRRVRRHVVRDDDFVAPDRRRQIDLLAREGLNLVLSICVGILMTWAVFFAGSSTTRASL
jgi:hypothetical protein